MSLRDLTLRLRALVRPRQVEAELDDELAFHLERETEKLIANGVPPAEARIQARARFGSVALAADECRDARGTAFIDNTARDVGYALRSFRRAPLAAATIVLTVGLGLGLVAVVFTFYNAWFLQADAVRSPSELFAVDRPPTPGDEVWFAFKYSEFKALRRETRVFTDVVATAIGVTARIEGRPGNATLVTGNFFEVLGGVPALGRTLIPSDDEGTGGRPVLLLSHRGWVRLFGRDPAVVGRRVTLNGTEHEIVGVMPAAFRGLGTGWPDCWAPLGRLSELRDIAGTGDDAEVDEVIGRLRPGISPAQAQATLTAWATGRAEMKREKGHPAYVRLNPGGRFEPDRVRGLKTFAPLFVAFALVLLIGCANVANLLLARGVVRQREIGVRLALGASRRRLVRQLLTENLLLALAAAACGFVIARLLVEIALGLLLTTMPPEFAEGLHLIVPPGGLRVVLFLFSGAVVATMFFGLMPALQSTRLELVRTMRGELTRDARPGRARGALIAAQVGASALLLICAAVFLRSAAAAATQDPGIRTHDIVTIDLRNEPRRPAVLHEVASHPAIAAVGASSPGPMGILNNATAETSAARAVVAYQLVSPEYFPLLEIEVLRGRGFTAAERNADAGVVVVSERVVGQLWPDRNPLGEVVRLEAWKQPPSWRWLIAPSRAYTVIGVARDVGQRLALLGMDFARPGVYLPTDASAAGTVLTARVHGDPARARVALLERLTRVDPALGDIVTLRTMASAEAYILRAAFWTTVTVGVLALGLTLSGLFGVLTYLIEQRRREFGVRMALGATARDISRLVVTQSAWPVGIGLVTGGALATALAAVLLSLPAAGQIGAVVHVSDPLPYVAGLACIAIACLLAALVPARRASRIDPIETLRQE